VKAVLLATDPCSEDDEGEGDLNEKISAMAGARSKQVMAAMIEGQRV